MKFVSLNDVLPQAKAGNFAVPQFNVNGYLWVEAIIEAANELEKSIIIGVTDKNVERLGGYAYIANLINIVYDYYAPSQPLVLHLDHGQSVSNCKKAIDAGFSSVMFDGSKLSIEDNISRTKEVVNYAHANNVSVEGEVGSVGGVEDGITSNVRYADPEQCIYFIKETKIDALAAALGSVHGDYIEKPNLQFKFMNIINANTMTPLVLHGASGINDSDIRKVINYGHAKVNYNTDLNKSVANVWRDILIEDRKLYDPKILLEKGKNAIKEVVTQKIELLNNSKMEEQI